MRNFLTRLSSTPTLLIVGFLSLYYATFSCLAWPLTMRRSYQYYPSLMGDVDPLANQWDLAQEPLNFDQLLDDYSYNNNDNINNNNQWSEQALSDILDLYPADASSNNNGATWGQIVNEYVDPEEDEDPEAEIELEDLKSHHGGQYYQPQLKRQPAPHHSAHEIVTKSPLSPTSASKVTTSTTVSITSKPKLAASATGHRLQGQKEVPLLRPPARPKTTEAPKVGVEPVISERSPPKEKKMSPYDTLRKYLSIEDALKKEAEKRRDASMNSRQMNKRSGSTIIRTDDESLSGQLQGLKKTEK